MIVVVVGYVAFSFVNKGNSLVGVFGYFERKKKLFSLRFQQFAMFQ